MWIVFGSLLGGVSYILAIIRLVCGATSTGEKNLKGKEQPRSQGRHCLPLVIDVGPGTGCRKSGHLGAILFCIIYHLQTHYKLSYNIYSQNELNSMKHMPIDFDA